MKKIDIKKLHESSAEYDKKQVVVGGWVRSCRSSKTFGFIDLNDGTSFTGVQIVFENNLDNFEEIEKLGQIELSAKAGESGKLFGTITTKKLCEELKEKANIEVDRKTVSLNAPINKVGEFTMLIKLTSKVKTELKVVVTASEVVKESIEEEVVEEIVEA